ncbi:MAG: PIN domain-containing protein [bacterium]
MIFVDTGAWIALTDSNDHYHKEANRLYNRLKQQRAYLLTTDYVLDETVTRLRYDSSHHIAIRFLDIITLTSKTGILRVVYIDHDLFQESIAVFRQYESTLLSLTDCANFVVCQRYNIHDAFGFDRHFPMMGISLIS